MLGTPASTSAMNRTGDASHELAEYSDEVHAASMPTGMPTTLASADQDAVPTSRVLHPAGISAAPSASELREESTGSPTDSRSRRGSR